MDEKLITLEMEETTESHIDTENTESIVEQIEETTDSHIDADDIEPIVEQEEVIEYVEVEDVEEVNIEIDEAVGWVGGDPSKHYSLSGRDEPNQHEIVAITGLEEKLNILGDVKNVYAKSGGFAEMRKWVSGKNKGVGYFVSLVNGADGNTYVDICNENTDVYGVTVMTDEVGFYGYQDTAYNEIDPTSPDISDDPTYAKVCLLGNVKVRVTEAEYAAVNVGDYVIPNDLGYASIYSNTEEKIKHSIGFKVISKGQREGVGTSWYYVGIALVPQNDNVSRVMKKLEDAQVNLEGIKIQLGTMSGELEGVKDSNIQLGDGFKGLQDLVNESNNKVDTLLPEMEQKLQEAVDEVVSEANKTINDMTLEYTEAVSKADEALKQSASAIGTVDGIRDDLEPLAQWQDKGSLKEAVTGFVAQADKDHVSLSALTERVDENQTNIIAVTQKIDDNGASIEQLVARADRYSLGPHSLSDKFTYDEAISMLKPGHIYVPTEEHSDETSYIKEGASPISFTVGKSYMWKANDTGVYTWAEYNDVYTWTSYDSVQSATGLKDGDLWYCWQGIVDPSNTDKILYDAETLYRWDGVRWVSVATVEGSVRSRSIGLLKQTADELTVNYTNLDDKVATMKIDMDEISTTVMDVKEGLSEIEQTATNITLGLYNPEQGSTSLGLLLGGMESVSNYGGRVCIKHAITDSPTISGNRYLQSPMWNGEEFIFAEGALDNKHGEYYFGSDDHTEYYKLVDDGYEVYTIGNEAMALLRTNVDENKAAIEGLVKYVDEEDNKLSTNIATIQAQADANESKIASVASGEYLVCTSIDLELTSDEISKLPSVRYDNPPTWGNKGFAFSGNNSENGIYYMLSNDTEHYYKLLLDDNDDIVGYEQYALASIGSAEIMQLVTKNGSSIGMIVENDKVKASIIAEAINDSDSSVTIDANKINFDGFTTFTNSSDFEKLKGEAIKSVEVQYISWGSMTSAPPEDSEDWKPVAPEWVDDEYIWQRTVVTYASGNVDTSDATCISGAKGDDGDTPTISIDSNGYWVINGSTTTTKAEGETPTVEINSDDYWVINGEATTVKAKGDDGEKGDAGQSITKVTPQYYLSSSKTTCIGGTWRDNEPTWKSNNYIWTRSKITWDTLDEDGNSVITYTTAILASALNSANETANNAATKANTVDKTLKDLCLTEGDKTFIDGGKIYTHTITSSQLSADAITSNNYNGTPIKKIKSEKMHGVKIGTKNKYVPVGDALFSFVSGQTTYVDPTTGATEDIGKNFWFVGKDLSFNSTTIYFIYNDTLYDTFIYDLSSLTGDSDYACFVSDTWDIPEGVMLDVYDYESIDQQTVPAIIQGEDSDYLTYCFRPYGEIITLSSSDTFYYFCSELSVGAELTQITNFYDHMGNDGLGYVQISSSSTIGNKQGYIIYFSDFTYFDGVYKNPSNGTKLDLDIGSIYSKNFILNEYGDAFVSGRIAIESGYIGDKNTGFEIVPNCWTYEWAPLVVEGKAGLELSVGKHYLPYNEKYYSFELDKPLSYHKNLPTDVKLRVGISIEKTHENLRLCVTDRKTDDTISHTYYNVAVSDTKPSDGVCVNLSEWNLLSSKDYYIGSKQRSLQGQDDGENYGDQGVFISPEGIGLGHGRFWVNNTGTCMSIAGANIRHWDKFDGETVSVFAIETSSGSEGSVFATRDIFDDSGWAAIMITPKVPTKKTNSDGVVQYTSRSTIDVWASIDMNGNSISNQSDSRLKTNIVDTSTNAIDLLNSIELKSFDWIDSGKHVDVGLIAQQLEKVVPSLVVTNEKTGLKGITYTELIPYLIKAIQELSAIVNPPIALLSLDNENTSDTHWTDDMTEDEKLHYVELSRPLVFKNRNQ